MRIPIRISGVSRIPIRDYLFVTYISILDIESGGSETAAPGETLRLLLKEAGTMRGLLTRSCREFFGYTLAEAQEAVRLLDQELLRKRFWEVSEDEFREMYDWLRQG